MLAHAADRSPANAGRISLTSTYARALSVAGPAAGPVFQDALSSELSKILQPSRGQIRPSGLQVGGCPCIGVETAAVGADFWLPRPDFELLAGEPVRAVTPRRSRLAVAAARSWQATLDV